LLNATGALALLFATALGKSAFAVALDAPPAAPVALFCGAVAAGVAGENRDGCPVCLCHESNNMMAEIVKMAQSKVFLISIIFYFLLKIV
jgi:hypothetical protein